MIRARDESNIIVQVGLCLRFSPVFWYIKQMINDPENQVNWGRLQNVIFRDSQDKPYTGMGPIHRLGKKILNKRFTAVCLNIRFMMLI